MKYYNLIIILALSTFGQVSAQGSVEMPPTKMTFHSTDTLLNGIFLRAKNMANSYRGHKEDPGYPWYESALPPRFAYCMRDVSHMALAAEVLGMGQANKNMFRQFAKHISKSRDWCSFWEIDKFGQPSVYDYKNDQEFWYNLSANFEVLNAFYQLYLWTGDKEYIEGEEFTNFQERTVTEFINKWELNPGQLLIRQSNPNPPKPFNPKNKYLVTRGLPSYSEGVNDMKIGVDLIASIYRGLMSYSEILAIKGNRTTAKKYSDMAVLYLNHIDQFWWNSKGERSYTYYSNSGEFGHNEGETFLIWFDALKNQDRKKKTITHLYQNDWNVENQSYFPLIMYQAGLFEQGYGYMKKLTNQVTKRHEYPEVSFGVIKGLIEGLMGICPNATTQTVATLYRGESNVITSVENVPIFGQTVSLTHDGREKSNFSNLTDKPLIWQAGFIGSFKTILFGSTKIKCTVRKDLNGNLISFAEYKLAPGMTMVAQAE